MRVLLVLILFMTLLYSCKKEATLTKATTTSTKPLYFYVQEVSDAGDTSNTPIIMVK